MVELEPDFEFKFAKLNLFEFARALGFERARPHFRTISRPKMGGEITLRENITSHHITSHHISGANSHRCHIPGLLEVGRALNSLRSCAVVQILEIVGQMLHVLHELLPHTP